MSTELQKLHEVEIEILDYVVDLCEKNDLTYSLAYGTAIGALRHEGFIPWDDDLDIEMPRKDYKKLLEIIEKNPSDKYELQNEKNEKNWFLIFSKIRKKGTIFAESIVEGIYENNGIYIDIFPLDYVKDANAFSFKIKRKIIAYLRHLLKFQSCKDLYKENSSKIVYLIELFITLPVRIAGVRKTLDLLNRLLEQKNTDESNCRYIAQFDDDVNSKALILPYDIYFPVRKLTFEGKQYNVPNKVLEYLQAEYGEDVMQLPPEEKRTTHMPKYIKF